MSKSKKTNSFSLVFQASQARPGVGPHLATAARPRGGGTAPDQLQAPIKSSAGLLLKERAQDQLQSVMKPFRKGLARQGTPNQLQSAIKPFRSEKERAYDQLPSLFIKGMASDRWLCTQQGSRLQQSFRQTLQVCARSSKASVTDLCACL